MDKVSIIIPAFNEAENIKQVVGSIKDIGYEHEVIVVDDGSTDGTYQAAVETGAKVVRHPYNHGYGAALKRGIREATGNIIFTMDADLQHKGDSIGKICSELINKDYDMVVGIRSKKSHTPLLRKPGKLMLAMLANYLANKRIPDLNSGFRAIRRDILIDMLPILPNGFSFTTTITLAFIKEGFSTGHIPITTTARKGKKSRVNIINDGYETLMLIVRTIMLFNPLKVFVPVSMALFIWGAIYGGYYVVLNTNIPDGSVLFILSGISLFCFGLVADQISHIRLQLKNRK